MISSSSEVIPNFNFDLHGSPQPEVKFTYSRPEFSLRRRLVIRAVELATGQPKLEKLYRQWTSSHTGSETVFAAAVRLLGIKVETDFRRWRALPKTGPLLIVANHPYGVLDGLTLCYLTGLGRSDFKIMTHSLLCQPEALKPYMLPVDFGGTEQARARTVKTRRETIEWLQAGHVVVMFPAGGVSTAVSPFSRHVVDCAWHPFVAKLARLPDVRIVPVFFGGQNSRLFQVASHFSYTMRLALLFRESLRRSGQPLQVSIGNMISASELLSTDDRSRVAEQLRAAVYAVGGDKAPDAKRVFEFPRWMTFD